MTTECHSVRSWRSPVVLSRQLSDVATRRLTTVEPLLSRRTSGSRPRLPTRMTLLTLPAMTHLLFPRSPDPNPATARRYRRTSRPSTGDRGFAPVSPACHPRVPVMFARRVRECNRNCPPISPFSAGRAGAPGPPRNSPPTDRPSAASASLPRFRRSPGGRFRAAPAPPRRPARRAARFAAPVPQIVDEDLPLPPRLRHLGEVLVRFLRCHHPLDRFGELADIVPVISG